MKSIIVITYSDVDEVVEISKRIVGPSHSLGIQILTRFKAERHTSESLDYTLTDGILAIVSIAAPNKVADKLYNGLCETFDASDIVLGNLAKEVKK